jgi:hypothetical protein
MRLNEAAGKLAMALKRAIGEHGTPNSFGCQELEILYGGPPTTLAGRVANRPVLLQTVRNLTEQSTLTYTDRRFHVEEGETPCPKL